MKCQETGKPEISFSWFLKSSYYTKENCKSTLDTDEGKKYLIDAILLCIEQGKEIRLGTDGECLIMEANDVEFQDGSYQWIDEDHYVAGFDNSDNGSYDDSENNDELD